MELENNFRPESLEARGAMCVECLSDLGPDGALVDRCGAALCRACAAEFYAPCGACGGLVPRDEALTPDGPGAASGALLCAECFRAAGAGGETPPAEEEVEALVARYVALHAEKKRVEEEMDEVKERLKLAAAARPRVAGAVVLRAGDAGVRCSYSVRTTWDAEKLSAAESLLGGERFSALFERKVSFTPLQRERVDDFLGDDSGEWSEARELVRAAAQVSETTTLNVIAPRKKKQA